MLIFSHQSCVWTYLKGNNFNRTCWEDGAGLDDDFFSLLLLFCKLMFEQIKLNKTLLIFFQQEIMNLLFIAVNVFFIYV